MDGNAFFDLDLDDVAIEDVNFSGVNMIVKASVGDDPITQGTIDQEDLVYDEQSQCEMGGPPETSYEGPKELVNDVHSSSLAIV